MQELNRSALLADHESLPIWRLGHGRNLDIFLLVRVLKIIGLPAHLFVLGAASVGFVFFVLQSNDPALLGVKILHGVILS